MSFKAYEIPGTLLCALCGGRLRNSTPFRHHEEDDQCRKGKSLYTCHNISCAQHDKHYWYRFRELILDEKGDPNEPV